LTGDIRSSGRLPSEYDGGIKEGNKQTTAGRPKEAGNMENPKFQIIRGENEKYYFRLRTADGEIVLHSDGFRVRDGAQKSIELIKLSVYHEERFKRKISLDGRYYFDILSMEKNILGTSKMYDTIQGCDKAINLVKDLAPDATIEDSSL
jgi:uncharacterized protein YegP (UPF0339 family)